MTLSDANPGFKVTDSQYTYKWNIS